MKATHRCCVSGRFIVLRPSFAMSVTITPVAEADAMAEARAIREAVFIEEQDCPPEEEWDGHDATARHLLARLDDGTAVGTARWRTVLHNETPVAKLERFAVRTPHRGKGIGAKLVRHAIADAKQAGFTTQKLHAQAHLETYYARFGFRSTGERFTEAGIPHVAMVRTSAHSERSSTNDTTGAQGAQP